MQGIDPNLKVDNEVLLRKLLFQLAPAKSNIMIDKKNIGINTESCSDLNGSQEFKCECMDGYDGKICEAVVCSSNYCNNNGLCSIEEDNGMERLQCECFDGFEGQRCQIDSCDNFICENGFCDAGSCICKVGYINMESICEETCQTNRADSFIHS